jgi:flagellar basal-body rod protein FlgB
MSYFEPKVTALIDEKIRYATQRQVVLAQNVANIDTPNYKAQDLKAPDFRKILAESTSTLAVTRTNPAHLNAVPHHDSYRVVPREATAELKPNGNNVSLETEMQAVAQNQADHQLAIGLDHSMDKLFKIILGQQGGG